MRFGMMEMVTMLAAASAGMAHGERENRGLSPIIPAQVVLIAQAPQAGTPVKERVIGSCQAIDYRTPDGEDGSYWPEFNGGLDPQTPAELYFSRYENRPDVQRPPLDAVEVLTQPQHGVVKLGVSGGGDPGYNYIPDVDYIGTDKVAFRVMTSAGSVVVQYYLVVTNKGSESKAAERLCDKGSKRPNSMAGWKISSSFTTPTLDNAALQALLDATGINNTVTVTTADLTGGAVGQTTNSTITLDTNAAGYGWYLDYTPYLNDEYLPTSNPNVWVAKAGTEAAGKMDLLSVLLHEYGHALGHPHERYLALGASAEERQANYRELFRYELDPGVVDRIRSATNGNFALGDNRFAEQVAATLGRRVVPGKPGRPMKVPEPESGSLF